MFRYGIEVPWEPDASLYRAGVRLWRFDVNTHARWSAGAYVVTTQHVDSVDGATLVAEHDGERWVWRASDVECRRTHALGAGVSAPVEV